MDKVRNRGLGCLAFGIAACAMVCTSRADLLPNQVDPSTINIAESFESFPGYDVSNIKDNDRPDLTISADPANARWFVFGGTDAQLFSGFVEHLQKVFTGRKSFYRDFGI